MNTRTLLYDLRQIKNDSMVIISIVVPVLVFVIMKFVYPLFSDLAISSFHFDITPYTTSVAVFLLPVIPMMFGMSYGFILLDERDGGIITALSVTPLGKSGYLKLRLGIPVTFSFLAMLTYCFLLHLNEQTGIPRLLTVCFLFSFTSPLMLLFLGAFSANKVEGMALTKVFGLLLLAIPIDLFVPAPWNWIGAYSPLFWVERTWFSSSMSELILYSLISLSFYLLLLTFLFRKFNKMQF